MEDAMMGAMFHAAEFQCTTDPLHPSIAIGTLDDQPT
jgi:hypothetical protein